MKFLTFVTASQIFKFVSSSKCVNPGKECVQLCCGEDQYYEPRGNYCADIPADIKQSWIDVLNDNATSEIMEFVEYGKCETSNDLIATATIPMCYSPIYVVHSELYGLTVLYDVPCDREEKASVAVTTITGVGALFIFLSIMVIYTCWKGSNEKFMFKLVSWYLASMAITLFIRVALFFVPMGLLENGLADISLFFFTSSYLWLNVVGFQMWSEFKGGNVQNNSHRRRLFCYFMYVWGVAAIIVTTTKFSIGEQWVRFVDISVPLYNVVLFLILSVNICIIRCRFAIITGQDHFKWRLAYTIFRLCLMMGIPRMLLILTNNPMGYSVITVTAFFTLEPIVIFVMLLWKPNNCFQWNFLCFCCKKSKEISNAAEVIEIHDTSN